MKMKISIVGAGTVGRAVGEGFLLKGNEVIFIDIKPEVVRNLKRRGFIAYSPNESDNWFNCDISFIAVETPTTNGNVNLHSLREALADLGKRFAKAKKYHLFVIKSTVPPGTTDDIAIPLLEKFSGKKVGGEFGICMNPEFLRQNSALADFMNPWIIIIGEYDKKSGDLLHKAYEPFLYPTYRVSLKEAEMEKYLHNLFNAVKITFFNESREICKKTGIDAEKIFPLIAKSAEGMWNPLYGIRNLGPFGERCLTKDFKAFLGWLRTHKLRAYLLEETLRINDKLKKKSHDKA